MSIVIGVDPDSKRHGIAIYKDGQLIDLKMISLPEIMEEFSYELKNTRWAIEDVAGQKYQYNRNKKATIGANMEQMRCLGTCQQAQVELMRMLDYHLIDYKLIKPQLGNWAKNKAQFAKVTGWTGRSNEDTRSAAFFGWLALQTQNRG